MGVGAGFWLERGLFAEGFDPQSADHGVQYMVGLVAEPTYADLHGRVAVAEVIGGAGQAPGVVGAYGGHRFWLGNDLDDAPCVRRNLLAVLERGSSGQ